jgi:protoporphyrinogen IX oxidase
MYLFFKWLHLVSVISWMAGILYLYRLLIYQAERGSNQDIHELLNLMSMRLYRFITLPAMLVGLAAGTGMLTLNPALLGTGWIQIKLVCVLAIAAATIYAGWLVRQFATRTPNLPTGRHLRILNEVPAVLMMIIVGLAVFRPF